MIVIMPVLSGYASVLHVAVSLPLIPQILDHRKYLEPADMPPKQSRDLRRMRQTPRAPTLKAMVRLAAKCDSAEELGERLLKRYGRRESPRERAELDARLDRMLGEARATLDPTSRPEPQF